MDQKDRKIVDDAIQEFGDDFWNAENNYTFSSSNREGLVNELIEMLKQAGHELVVKPL